MSLRGGGHNSTAPFKKFRDADGRTGCYSEAYHRLYANSCWIVVRRIQNRGLSEGDLVVCFSQFGEVVDVRCVRSKSSGELTGYAFVRFQDPRSAVLAADNMNSSPNPTGVKIFLTQQCRERGVGIEVDHCSEHEVPQLPEAAVSYGQWYHDEMLAVPQQPTCNA